MTKFITLRPKFSCDFVFLGIANLKSSLKNTSQKYLVKNAILIINLIQYFLQFDVIFESSFNVRTEEGGVIQP